MDTKAIIEKYKELVEFYQIKLSHLGKSGRERDLLKELSLLQEQKEERVTDQMIEKQFPIELRLLCKELKIPESLWSAELSEALKGIQGGNLNKQIGAKWLRDKYEGIR